MWTIHRAREAHKIHCCQRKEKRVKNSFRTTRYHGEYSPFTLFTKLQNVYCSSAFTIFPLFCIILLFYFLFIVVVVALFLVSHADDLGWCWFLCRHHTDTLLYIFPIFVEKKKETFSGRCIFRISSILWDNFRKHSFCLLSPPPLYLILIFSFSSFFQQSCFVLFDSLMAICFHAVYRHTSKIQQQYTLS